MALVLLPGIDDETDWELQLRMRCLYCNKKLGLFASKKRPFCSQQHEVAYNDEQAGLALRRVMDPMFTTPVEKAPLQPGPRNGELSAKDDGAIGVMEPPPAALEAYTPPRTAQPEPPAVMSFLRQPRPAPLLPDLSKELIPIEFEAAPEKARLPVGLITLIEDEAYGEAPAELPAVEPPTVEPPAVEPRTPISFRLHPAVEQERPDWIGPEPSEAEPRPLSDDLGAPLSFGTELSRTPPLAFPVAFSLSSEALGLKICEPEALPDEEPALQELAPPPSSRLLGSGELRPESQDQRAERSTTIEAAAEPPKLEVRYPLADLGPAQALLEMPAPPPSSGLLGSAELRPESQDQPVAQSTWMEGALDPPKLEVRYPLADLGPAQALLEKPVPPPSSGLLGSAELRPESQDQPVEQSTWMEGALDPPKLQLRYPLAEFGPLTPLGAPAPPAGLLITADTRPESQDQPTEQRCPWTAAPLDPPQFALRYPFAAFALRQASMGAPAEPVEMPWTAAGCASTATNAVLLPVDGKPAEPQIPVRAVASMPRLELGPVEAQPRPLDLGARNLPQRAERFARVETLLDPPELALQYPSAGFARVETPRGSVCETTPLRWTAARFGAGTSGDATPGSGSTEPRIPALKAASLPRFVLGMVQAETRPQSLNSETGTRPPIQTAPAAPEFLLCYPIASFAAAQRALEVYSESAAMAWTAARLAQAKPSAAPATGAGPAPEPRIPVLAAGKSRFVFGLQHVEIRSQAPQRQTESFPGQAQRSPIVEGTLHPPDIALRYPSAGFAPAQALPPASGTSVAVRWTAGRSVSGTRDGAVTQGVADSTPEPRIPFFTAASPARPVLGVAHTWAPEVHAAPPLQASWKVFAGLREAPIKLGFPPTSGHASMRLAGARQGTVDWIVRDYSPVLGLRVEEIHTGLFAASIPAWHESAEVRRLTASQTIQRPWGAKPPRALPLTQEKARAMHSVQPPAIPEAEGPQCRTAQAPEFTWNIQQLCQASNLQAGLTGFQKARPASFIQIREPELCGSKHGELPGTGVWIWWTGVRPAAEARRTGSIIPLHPAVVTPHWTYPRVT